ncbi:MAG: CarD family transcriptional regulator [Desulfomonilaceae bacterium]|nr:CarD family transcriptional regulator [Desulfomonilaceae bacterium]
MLKVGEMVVYPIHGVARIVDIKNVIIGGSEQQCYILQSESTPQRPVIKLPVDKVESNRVRRVLRGEEVPPVIEFLKQRRRREEPQIWSKRYRHYQDKMRSGDIFETAEVYKDLSLLKETKDLSLSERKLFDQARNLLIKELSIAEQKDEEEVERYIISAIRRSNTRAEEDDAGN